MSFEQAMKRPSNYFELSSREQWDTDKRLGILDWNGDMTPEQKKEYDGRFRTKTPKKEEE